MPVKAPTEAAIHKRMAGRVRYCLPKKRAIVSNTPGQRKNAQPRMRETLGLSRPVQRRNEMKERASKPPTKARMAASIALRNALPMESPRRRAPIKPMRKAAPAKIKANRRTGRGRSRWRVRKGVAISSGQSSKFKVLGLRDDRRWTMDDGRAFFLWRVFQCLPRGSLLVSYGLSVGFGELDAPVLAG